MKGEVNTIRKATLDIHIGQLEQKHQKLSQLDMEILALIGKPNDHEQGILDSEEFQSMIIEGIC